MFDGGWLNPKKTSSNTSILKNKNILPTDNSPLHDLLMQKETLRCPENDIGRFTIVTLSFGIGVGVGGPGRFFLSSATATLRMNIARTTHMKTFI